MKMQKFIPLWCGLLMSLAMPVPVSAQGYLSDATTSSAVLTRDPARQASTEIDAVVTNPAGTAFINDGFHISLGGIFSYRDISAANADKPSPTYYTKETNILPTVQIAFKKNNWAVSASFASEGGFGNRKSPNSIYADELSIQQADNTLLETLNEKLQIFRTAYDIASLVTDMPALNMEDDDEFMYSSKNVNTHLHNWTIRLGGTYKFNEHFSAYVGVKANYVKSTGDGEIGVAISRQSTGERFEYSDYYQQNFDILNNAQTSNELIETTKSYLSTLLGDAGEMNHVGDMNTKTTGWGFAPIIGIDYKIKNFNFGAKYEFASHINAKGSEHFNVPATMSVGMKWQIIPKLSVAAGSNVVFATYNSIYSSQSLSGAVDIDMAITPRSLSRAYDLSASGTFEFNEKWLVSAGYTFGHEHRIAPEIIVFFTNTTVLTHKLSFGGAYSPIENMRINLGASIYSRPGNWRQSTTGDVTLAAHYSFKPKVQIALGIDYNF